MIELARFFVAGEPAPAGSKSGFPFVKNGAPIPPGGILIRSEADLTRLVRKRIGVAMADKAVGGSAWRRTVAIEARRYFDPPEKGFYYAYRFDFILARPKFHFTSKGVIRPAAPALPGVKPDSTKLARAVEDALKGIAWPDDAEVTDGRHSKRYGPEPGVWITIYRETERLTYGDTKTDVNGVGAGGETGRRGDPQGKLPGLRV